MPDEGGEVNIARSASIDVVMTLNEEDVSPPSFPPAPASSEDDS
jgi:hypothetical protein